MRERRTQSGTTAARTVMTMMMPVMIVIVSMMIVALPVMVVSVTLSMMSGMHSERCPRHAGTAG